MALWGDTDTLADVPKYEAPTLSFDGSDALIVDVTGDTISVPGHGLVTGDPVTYTAANTAITGLVDGTIYYAIRVDADTIQLAANVAAAEIGTDIDLTVVADVSGDTVQVTPDDIFFVDTVEATVAGNRQKGLNNGGWNKYRTYVDGNGATRHKREVLVAMRRTDVQATDAGVTGNTTIEDTTVADA